MAEQIISPGVFTRENDLSFLPQGIGQIGAAIIGPTVKGPAFVPTVVRSFSEFESRFGSLSSETYVPQTVREYLRNAGSVTVCRVLAGGGYTYSATTPNKVIILAVSGTLSSSMDATGMYDGSTNTYVGSTGNVIIGAIFPSKATSTPSLDLSAMVASGSGHISENFDLLLKGASGGTETTAGKHFSASLNPSNANYIFKQLGDNANNSKTGVVAYNGTPGYTYIAFNNLATDILGATTKEISQVTFGGGDANFATASLAANGTALGKTVIFGSTEEQFTIEYKTATAYTVTSGKALTGSLITVDLTDGDGTNHTDTPITIGIPGDESTQETGHVISSSEVASATATAINAHAVAKLLFSGSSSGSVLTITSLEAGASFDGTGFQTNISENHTTNPTASLVISTQGADVTGYPGIHANREVVLSLNNADISFQGLSGTTEKYSYASTPFVTSQFLDANGTTKELFKFHSLAHGTSTNTDYKISIARLREPSNIDGEEQYSSFSILVRKYDDTDKNPVVLEQFDNVNLDPDSTNYISRVFGDRYPQYNDTLDKVELLGNFPNKSIYCRVEVAESVAAKATSPKLSPKGFKPVINPIPTTKFATVNNLGFVFPSSSYEGVQKIGVTDSNYSTKGFLGWKFKEKDTDNVNFIKPLPSTEESNVSGEFNVENYNGHASSSLFTGSLSASLDPQGVSGPTAAQLKFTLPFQGGDDGIRPDIVRFTGAESTLADNYTNKTNLFGFDVSSATAAGYVGYKKAIDILSNQDEYDINMLVIPGAIKQYHSIITNAGIDMCEDRGDTFYVMDLASKDASVRSAVGEASGLDSNYAAVYYPWVKVLDTSVNKPVLVPPSVIVPGAIAASDRIAAEWFAPAGLNRGVLGNVLEAKIRLNQAERDELYDAKINPIATFPQTGVCIWGQKTLQERNTALNRINVRRLLIALKKFIASSSRYLVFEQNTVATRNRFLNIVNPYLESVQQRQGLFAFRVQMDEANNTPDVIDRNQLVGAIFIQPAKTAEFIVLDFNILPTGATFDNAGGAGGY